MAKLNRRMQPFAVCLLAAATSIASPSQTFSFFSFNGADGANPDGSLVQGTDGNFYGTTSGGGAYNYGTVFEISASGILTTLHSFDNWDGAYPFAGLLPSTNGHLYGTTSGGGANGDGTVFEITAGGTLTTLHSFNNTEGFRPLGGLVQAPNGDFYGTASLGGNPSCNPPDGCGTVFEITPGGTLTTLYSIDSYTQGLRPYAGLALGADGNFYGTTSSGGVNDDGTVFKITPAGTLTVLHSFDSNDGFQPIDELIQGGNGNFYGTTSGGGAYYDGTVFEITAEGALSTLHNFDATDGAYPYDQLVQGTDENFYGTTKFGGAIGNGTVFKMTPEGALTLLHSFDGSDGASPYAGLVQGTDGAFYGTTFLGGADNYGTIFTQSVGLGPFVKTLPGFGRVGSEVGILGNNLPGTTSVSFNGIPATFTVRRGTFLTATVPAGATTGYVTVTTPSGTLTSNVQFHVLPPIFVNTQGDTQP